MALQHFIETIGIQKQAFAAAVGARPETLSRWLSGENVPSGENLFRILRLLNAPENLRRLGRRKPVAFEELFPSKAA